MEEILLKHLVEYLAHFVLLRFKVHQKKLMISMPVILLSMMILVVSLLTEINVLMMILEEMVQLEILLALKFLPKIREVLPENQLHSQYIFTMDPILTFFLTVNFLMISILYLMVQQVERVTLQM